MPQLRTLPASVLRPADGGGLLDVPLRKIVAHVAPWPAALGRWLQRLNDRDELRGLGERELRDIGISAYDVAFECRKPIWRD